jgi:hypothetical protein
MVTVDQFKLFALSFPNASEHPHMGTISFRVKTKIFATVNPPFERACVKLNEIDQSAFCSYDKNVMYPVENKWGKHGWTMINLKTIDKEMMEDAISTAYLTVTKPKK